MTPLFSLVFNELYSFTYAEMIIKIAAPKATKLG